MGRCAVGQAQDAPQALHGQLNDTRGKRSSSGALALRGNVVRVCHACNMAVEAYPEVARKAGLVLREGDPEWEAMSARAWRATL